MRVRARVRVRVRVRVRARARARARHLTVLQALEGKVTTRAAARTAAAAAAAARLGRLGRLAHQPRAALPAEARAVSYGHERVLVVLGSRRGKSLRRRRARCVGRPLARRRAGHRAHRVRGRGWRHRRGGELRAVLEAELLLGRQPLALGAQARLELLRGLGARLARRERQKVRRR